MTTRAGDKPTGPGMGIGGPVLERFIGSSDTFMSCHWGARELFCPARDRAPGMPLPSAAEILASLDRESINPADMRLMRAGQDEIPPRLWTQTHAIGVYSGSRVIRPAEVAKHVRQGSSVVVHDFQRYSTAARHACESLAASLRTPVRAVVFITPPEQTGLKIHLDPTEIFALQIAGTKEWTVYPQQRPVPRQGKTLQEAPSGAAGQQFVLHVGDCLYVPVGSPHVTRAHTDGISIHISFGVQPLYWRDILEHLISEALGHSLFEGTVSTGAPNEFPLHADLQRRTQALSDQLAHAADDMAGLDRFLEVRWRRTILNGELRRLVDD